jgi:hypothetical protein
MFRKSVFLLIFAVLLLGCKGRNESAGDSYYKEGKFRNAVNSYTSALQKGKISNEFYDSFVIAYASAAKQTAKKNASDDIILNYIEQIHKNLPKINPKYSEKKGTLDSVVQALSEIGIAQAKGQFEYEYTLQGFRNLDSAISIAKRSGKNLGPAQEARREAESAIVKTALENADGAENEITSEYTLLEAEVVAPNNAELKKALNAIRIKNRGTWLIFAEEIIGQRATRYVDKYGYVIAFPTLNIGPTSTSGEIAVWNAVGNNVPFDVNKIKAVSTSGEEVSVKHTGGGWCGIDGVDKKTGMFKEEKRAFKGSVGELRSEKACNNAKFTFAYKSGFVPDYVEYKDENNNIGRKYFGYK